MFDTHPLTSMCAAGIHTQQIHLPYNVQSCQIVPVHTHTLQLACRPYTSSPTMPCPAAAKWSLICRHICCVHARSLCFVTGCERRVQAHSAGCRGQDAFGQSKPKQQPAVRASSVQHSSTGKLTTKSKLAFHKHYLMRAASDWLGYNQSSASAQYMAVRA